VLGAVTWQESLPGTMQCLLLARQLLYSAYDKHKTSYCTVFVHVGKPQQSMPGVNAVEKAGALKRDLLEAIERFADHLPPNTLDELIDELGGPDYVAEVCHYIAVF